MKKAILWITILFVGIQFIKIEVPTVSNIKKAYELNASNRVLSILERSCFDCHSNNTNYPWYSKVAPISWYINSHIKKGRKILNFSKWNGYSKDEKIKILDRVPKAIIIRMPMPTYLWLHEDAKLSKEDKLILKSWSIKLKDNLEKR
jgi:hypothetical protein